MSGTARQADGDRQADREALVAAVRAVAKRLGAERMMLRQFLRETGTGAGRVYRHFNSWPALCAAAGLEPNVQNRRVPDEEIFAAMHAAFLALGGPCLHREFVARAPFSGVVLKRRFPSWRAALAAFRLWAVRNAPEFPHMEALDARIDPFAAATRARGAAGPTARSWPGRGRRTCGDPLGFRGLLFAPVNEGGVVMLFGMVAAELGYRIETVAPDFPDCTARRRVGNGRWEAVRIEFEYRSRSFQHHGHDAEACDVIVCWEHDWPDCPLEVLALREAIAALPAEA